MWGFLASHWDSVVMVLSLIVNALGGTGVVRPLVDLRKPPPGEENGEP